MMEPRWFGCDMCRAAANHLIPSAFELHPVSVDTTLSDQEPRAAEGWSLFPRAMWAEPVANARTGSFARARPTVQALRRFHNAAYGATNGPLVTPQLAHRGEPPLRLLVSKTVVLRLRVQ